MSTPPPALGTITVGIRRWHVDSGEITTIREPVTLQGGPSFPNILGSRMELCSCPQAPACWNREQEIGRGGLRTRPLYMAREPTAGGER